MRNQIFYKKISACESHNKSKSDLSASIELQTKEFERRGGSVSRIATGVTGNTEKADHGMQKNRQTVAKDKQRSKANG